MAWSEEGPGQPRGEGPSQGHGPRPAAPGFSLPGRPLPAHPPGLQENIRPQTQGALVEGQEVRGNRGPIVEAEPGLLPLHLGSRQMWTRAEDAGWNPRLGAVAVQGSAGSGRSWQPGLVGIQSVLS